MSLQIVAQRMKSVGNIQKITAAMKMVAASRLKGAQTKMEKSRGMVQPLIRMLGDQPGIEAEKTMIVPVSSDKGLCGGINTRACGVLVPVETTGPPRGGAGSATCAAATMAPCSRPISASSSRAACGAAGRRVGV